ncbi:MAG: hypothetical protein HGA75_18565, partial [Thiobacillus sp.]|nr:hypothetical protein [Thiobacillus sp.]
MGRHRIRPSSPAATRPRPWALAGIGILMLLVSACATRTPRPAAPEPVAVPAAWSGADLSPAGGTASLAAWWQHFDDPLL